MSIFIIDRIDRLGSNFMVQLSCYMIGKDKNYKMYYNKTTNKYIDNIFFRGIKLDSCELDDKCKEDTEELIKITDSVRGSPMTCVRYLQQDILSYFNDNYKQKFYELVKQEIDSSDIKLPWNDNNNIICIHVRLEDVGGKKDYNGKKNYNYIINLINNNKEYVKPSFDKQRPISKDKLIELVTLLQDKYKNKKIYIVTYTKIVPVWLSEVINNFHLNLLNLNTETYDLWCLINCDILVLSKSTFSQIAALYHQGSTIYYPYWGVAAGLGLGSKYDKSTNCIAY